MDHLPAYAPAITVQDRTIGAGAPTYIVAELSANHHQDFAQAAALVRAAAAAGADAVKLQTYTPDTITLDAAAPWFRINADTIWDGMTLYELYAQAAMPWEWQPQLQAIAAEVGIPLFASPFDESAVDFLASLAVPAYKVASAEIVDLPLIAHIARTGTPLIISTGMATLGEIEAAVQTARQAGATQLALLHCVSSYPARPAEMHLRTIPHLAATFSVPVGLSDHSLEPAVSVAAVALGACIIEKHLTLSREIAGPDSAFSLEPAEFAALVSAIRTAEQALGTVSYEPAPGEVQSRLLRPSLFVVQDMPQGAVFTPANVRSIRPGHGLAPVHIDRVLGQRARRDIRRGTPLDWSLLASPPDDEPLAGAQL